MAMTAYVNVHCSCRKWHCTLTPERHQLPAFTMLNLNWSKTCVIFHQNNTEISRHRQQNKK